jgi:hypothetical protein
MARACDKRRPLGLEPSVGAMPLGKLVASTEEAPMPLFWKPYRSDVTDFIATLKQRDPQLEERQRAGRALLWDKAQDRDASAEARDARVPQQPYVYQTKV